ncbi:MAG: GHMP kinase, partial [Clostridia bacterium]|nr:GHMP kinase [Clostridia bacterium]
MLEKLLEETFRGCDTEKVFAPYRICPMGAHIDHQYGLITGFAIDHGIELYYT